MCWLVEIPTLLKGVPAFKELMVYLVTKLEAKISHDNVTSEMIRGVGHPGCHSTACKQEWMLPGGDVCSASSMGELLRQRGQCGAAGQVFQAEKRPWAMVQNTVCEDRAVSSRWGAVQDEARQLSRSQATESLVGYAKQCGQHPTGNDKLWWFQARGWHSCLFISGRALWGLPGRMVLRRLVIKTSYKAVAGAQVAYNLSTDSWPALISLFN